MSSKNKTDLAGIFFQNENCFLFNQLVILPRLGYLEPDIL